MRRAIVALVAAALALVSACSSIPTSGPVEEVPFSAQPRGIDIAPEPPADGVTPVRLVEGFLQAMADPTDDYAVARQYLTTAAAARWDPSSAQILQASVSTESEGTMLTGERIGELDAAGRFTYTYGAVSLGLGLVQEDEQWRIGAPPEGLLLSRYIFERYYSRVPLYFMSRSDNHVVPDLVHVPESLLTPTRVIEALLGGPSPLIARSVTNALPAAATLGPEHASIDSLGVVTVDLVGLDPDMTTEARRSLGAQLLWSLTSIPRVTGLVVTQGGQAFALPGANAAGVLELAGQQGYQVLSRGSTPNLYGIGDGVPGRIGDDSRFVALLPRATDVADVAVSLDGVTAAYVDVSGKGLALGQLGGRFDPVDIAYVNLRSPQFALGTLWLMGDDEEGTPRLLTLDRAGQAVAVDLDLPVGATLEGFAVSPTRARIALVLGVGEDRVLGITALLPSGTVSAGWAPLSLVTSRGVGIVDVAGVAWQSETALALIGSTPGGRSVYVAQSDGSLVEDLGPVVGDVEEITAMARLGGGAVAIRNGGGMVWRYEARTRWTRVMEGISAIGFGS